MKKSIKITVIITIIAVVLLALYAVIAKHADAETNALKVRLEKPARGELIEYVTCPGQIEPKKKVTISAKVSARITALPYKMGDRVTCGDANAVPPIPPSVLIRLDATELETELNAALATKAALAAQLEVEKESLKAQQGAIDSVAATLKQAEIDLGRKKELLRTQDISQSTFDQSQSRFDELHANLDSAAHKLEASKLNLLVIQHNLEGDEARIQKAREALTYTTIVSPINGVITQINAEVGEVVIYGTMNNPGTVIMEVADLSKMLVAAQVDEVDISKIKKDQKAKVRISAFDHNDFTGVVDTVALKNSTAQNTSKYFRTEILLDTSGEKIYSGLTADVDIEVEKHVNVLKIPSQAIVAREVDTLPQKVRDNNSLVDKTKTFASVVYKYIDGKAVVTPIRAGASDLQYTIIEAGLTDDDVVVVGPYKALEALKHDQKITDENNSDKSDTKPNKVSLKK